MPDTERAEMMSTHPHRTTDIVETWSEAQKDLWRQLLDEFLRAEGEKDAEVVLQNPKPARLFIHNFTCAIYGQLVHSCGYGLHHFQGPTTEPELRASVETADLAKPAPPFPSMAIHQGGDGLGACFCLFYEKQLRLAILLDPAHRIAKNSELDVKNAVQWLFVLTMSVLYNLHWGSWGGCRWQHEVAAAVKDLIQVRRGPDVLGQWVALQILHEWGESDRSLEPAIEKAIGNHLPETPAFTQRLQK